MIAAEPWMARWWLVLGVGCTPRIDPGPAPAVVAAQPVTVGQNLVSGAAGLTVSARVRAGSSTDPAGREGLAALTARAVASAAGAIATVDRESAVLTRECPPDEALACASSFARAIAADGLTAEAVAAERERARERLVAVRADPAALAAAALELLLYEAHPYGHLPDGRLGALELLGPDDVVTFHRRFWVRSAVTVELTGAWPDGVPEALGPLLEPLSTAMRPDVPLVRPLRSPRLALLPTGDPGLVVYVGAWTPDAAPDPAWTHPYWSANLPSASADDPAGAVRAALALAGDRVPEDQLSVVVVGGDPSVVERVRAPAAEGVAPLPFAGDRIVVLSAETLFD